MRPVKCVVLLIKLLVKGNRVLKDMIKIVRLFVAFLALISFLQVDAVEKPDWAQLGHFQYQNATLKTSPLAVFIGDSVTDCWSDNVLEIFLENYYAGRGVSGQVSSQIPPYQISLCVP